MSKNNESDVKPLTENDVLDEMKKIVKIPPKVLNEIFQTYSNTLTSLLSLAKQQCTDESDIVELERLKRVISLCPLEEKFIRTKDKIWSVRIQIIAKDSQYFIEKDYSANIKKDQNQIMMETLMELTVDKFSNMSDTHKEAYWKKLLVLLNLIARYKKAIIKYSNTPHL
jgi:CII-binding regulator of phage lambda lysogenization HflD